MFGFWWVAIAAKVMMKLEGQVERTTATVGCFGGMSDSDSPSRPLIMASQPTPLVSLNKALLNPYFWGGTLGGGCLNSHDLSVFGCFQVISFHSVVVSNSIYFHPDPWGNDPI